MSKKNSVDVNIPYMGVTEQGLIKVAPGRFAYTFNITHYKSANSSLVSSERILTRIATLNADFQFSIYKFSGSECCILTVGLDAYAPSEAMSKFNKIKAGLSELWVPEGINLSDTKITPTLSLFHGIYHNFDKWERRELGGKPVTQKGLKKAGVSTKTMIAPSMFDVQLDYIKTSENSFVRLLSLNSFADNISPQFIEDITGEDDNLVFSVHYHPVNPSVVYETLNSELEDLKQQVSTLNSSVYPNAEEIRIKEGYLTLLTGAIKNKKPVYQMTFLLGLFENSIKELDVKTKKLQKQCSTKTLCRFISLDYQQEEALASLLPLAAPKIKNNRMFSSSSAALFVPTLMGLKTHTRSLNNGATDFFTIKAKIQKAKKNSSARQIKRTVQETIPFIAAYPDNGIFENEPGVFSKMYRFSDINYHTATEDDQYTFLEKYAQLLNRIDSSVKCQIVLMNKNVDLKDFKEHATIKLKDDGLDLYRKEYNNMIVAKMEEGRNNLKKERYFVVSTEAENISAAKMAFSRIDPEMIASFKEIGGSQAETLTTAERLELFYDIYNIGHEGTFLTTTTKDGRSIRAFNMDEMAKLGITSKDMIAPSSFYFKHDQFRMGKKYCRVLYLTDLPNSLSDKFLSDLTAINCNLIVSMNLDCMRPDKAVSLTRRQLTNINVSVQKAQQTASKNGYSMELVPPEILQAQKEAEDLLSGLTGANQKMFVMTFTVLVYGDTPEELETNTDMLVSAGHKYLCNLKILEYQQEDGLAATLPLCNNRLSIRRTLTTNSTVIFVPFDVQELNQEGGLYYGQNASSHNLIIYDRKQAQNGNGWILGTPGSGKSFSAKREIASVILNTDDDVLIIDPEREYSPMVKAFGGSIVRVAPGSKWHLNPLDLDPDYADGDDPIVLKSDFMISLCETAVGGKYGLDPVQNSIIDRCVRMVYKDYMTVYNMDPAHTPTLYDFQRCLESQPEMAAKELAIALEIYTKGALDVFAHRSNVDINNRFVVYDIKDIGSSALRTLAYLVVLDNIWDRVVKNRRLNKRTWVYMDEIYVLFEREQSTNFIRQIFSRGRKYGAVMTALTQNVSPILANDVATTMLSNSAFIELLNQAPVDRDLLAGLLNISPQQVSFINSASPGHGLLYVQNCGIIPFADNFPKNICPELYKVMTSKPDELMEEFR